MNNDDNDNSDNKFYVTTYCNFAHRLADGEALGEEGDDEWHECTQLSPTKLRIEMEHGPNAVPGAITEFFPGERKALAHDDTTALERLYWRHAPNLTLDDLLDRLTALRKESPLGGRTVVHVCLIDSGIEYLQPKRVRLETDADGVMVVLDDGDHGLGEQSSED